MMMLRVCAIALAALLVQAGVQPGGVTVFTGFTLIDGTGAAPVPDAVLVVRSNRVAAAGAAETTHVPEGAERIDLSGRFVMPGLVNAHGHVGSTIGLETTPEGLSADNLRRQLRLYARYGVTTVVSLGDEGDEGFRLRDRNSRPDLDRARLHVAGPVIAAKTPADARAAVDRAAESQPDWIKIRVDDNLGASAKMPPEVFRAVIERAHERGLRVAAHIFYLEDAKELLRAGVDYIAHSVRDQEVDAELVALLRARDVCVSPTLMREVSTFVYESRPAFFDDPFFTREVDRQVIAALADPDRQAAVAKSRSAQLYKKGLEVARRNVSRLHAAGVRIASGTDTGPPARFQGYFEHLELEELVRSGLTPEAALLAGTSDAARCVGLGDEVGVLQPERFADFVVLTHNPLEDIRHTRTIESAWIGGRKVEGLVAGDR